MCIAALAAGASTICCSRGLLASNTSWRTTRTGKLTWPCAGKKGKQPVNERVPLQLARTANEVWSMDFVSYSLSGGRRLKYLTVADDFSDESVSIVVNFDISGQYVTRVLDRAAVFRGYRRRFEQTTTLTLTQKT